MRSEHRPTASIFASLGDETRLLLIARLCDDGPLSIAELTTGTRVTRQAITKHLRVMESSGLVRCTRQGRETHWTLEHKRLEEARRYLEMISKEWDARLERLRAHVDD